MSSVPKTPSSANPPKVLGAETPELGATSAQTPELGAERPGPLAVDQVRETSSVERVTRKTRAQRKAIDAGSLIARAGETDAAQNVPPHSAISVESEKVQVMAQRLRRIADLCADPDAAAIFKSSAAAVKRSLDLPFLEKPSWEAAFKEDARRPAILEGTLERKLRGADEKQRAHLLFRPLNQDIQAFPIPADVVQGLPHGARFTLKSQVGELGEKIYRVVTAGADYVRTMIADVELVDGKVCAVGQGLLAPYGAVPLEGARAKDLLGQSIIATIDKPELPIRTAKVAELLGIADGPKARFMQAATDAGVDLEFPAEVMEEIAALKKDPGIEGKDLTHLPFITIDNEDSMDLDQAMCIRKVEGGYEVYYAIADAQHFVREGSAIDAEARRRALTTYLPDRSLPMLPRELSEDLCSLVADQNRRAFVVTLKLDAKGRVLDSSFERGVVKSRAKLNYKQVQRFHDAEKKDREAALVGKDFTPTLELLERIGQLRIREAKARKVVESSDTEARIGELPNGKFGLQLRRRNEVEKWNEQVSLLANEAVGKFLAASGAKVLHRQHLPPEPAALEAFRAKVGAIGLPWAEGVELSHYVDALDPADPRTKAVRRLASKINKKATYGVEPLGHAALKLNFYDHFTAPMRRYPDIVVHRVLAALIEGTELPHQDDAEMEKIIGRVEAARRRNNDIGGRCQAYMLAEMMKDELFVRKRATVIDVSPQGALVELENPAVQVPMTTAAMRSVGGGNFALEDNGVALVSPHRGSVRLGEQIDVTIIWADPTTGIVDAVPSSLLKAAA